MKEYWVNVYEFNGRNRFGSYIFKNSNDSWSWGRMACDPFIYRIHVKMKPSIKEIIEDAQNSLKYLPNTY